MVYCGQCGAKNPDDIRFCSSCGANLCQPSPDTHASEPQSPNPIKTFNPTLLAVIVVLALVLIGSMIFFVLSDHGTDTSVSSLKVGDSWSYDYDGDLYVLTLASLSDDDIFQIEVKNNGETDAVYLSKDSTMLLLVPDKQYIELSMVLLLNYEYAPSKFEYKGNEDLDTAFGKKSCDYYYAPAASHGDFSYAKAWIDSKNGTLYKIEMGDYLVKDLPYVVELVSLHIQ